MYFFRDCLKTPIFCVVKTPEVLVFPGSILLWRRNTEVPAKNLGVSGGT